MDCVCDIISHPQQHIKCREHNCRDILFMLYAIIDK